MSDVFSTGITGLNVAQTALNTIANNVANANTPGYARQVVSLANSAGSQSGQGYSGNGVSITGIQALVDPFLESQLTKATSAAAATAQSDMYFSQLQSVLSDGANGISTSQSTFQGTLGQVATNPSSVPARQQVLASATALASSIKSVASQIQSQRDGVTKTIGSTIASANSLLSQIAKLNDLINKSEPRDINSNVLKGQEANDLRSQRQELVNQLSKIATVSTIEENEGLLVSIGGAAVVVSNKAGQLSSTQDPLDPSKLAVGIATSAGQVTLGANAIGGQLGAALRFVDDGVNQSLAQLSQYAGVLAQAFNDQSAKGVDLYGNPGVPFFTVDAPEVGASSKNTGNLALTVSVDAYATQPSDYKLTYSTTTGYNLTRLSDSTVVASGPGLPLAADGLTLTSTAGAIASGDSYLIKPFGGQAQDISVAIKDPKQLALSNPVATSAAAANTSRATISQPKVVSGLPLDANLTATVTIDFTSSTQYTISGAGIPGSPLAGQAYVSGSSITYNGWEISITGTPKAGDQFTVQKSNGAQGDGSNANSIVDLLQGKNFAGGSSTLADLYGGIQSDIGNKANLAQNEAQSAASVLNIATSQRNSYSGVNLDQEAADLARWQQIYSANAQVLSIAQDLFQSLLNKLG